MQKPIRKELIDTWYDLALDEIRANPDLALDSGFIVRYIEDLENQYRIYCQGMSLSNDGRVYHSLTNAPTLLIPDTDSPISGKGLDVGIRGRPFPRADVKRRRS